MIDVSISVSPFSRFWDGNDAPDSVKLSCADIQIVTDLCLTLMRPVLLIDRLGLRKSSNLVVFVYWHCRCWINPFIILQSAY